MSVWLMYIDILCWNVLQVMLRKNIFLYMYFLVSPLPVYMSAPTDLKEGPGGAMSFHLGVLGDKII